MSLLFSIVIFMVQHKPSGDLRIFFNRSLAKNSIKSLICAMSTIFFTSYHMKSPVEKNSESLSHVLSLVILKYYNGGTRPPAEQVERRTQVKRNSRDGHTVSTQREDSVLQARTRVRRFAQQNKKERLTSLLHHVNEASLGKAYLGLKRHAAPGEDGVTWED